MRKYPIVKALRVRDSYRESIGNIYSNVARFHWSAADLNKHMSDLRSEESYRRLPLWAIHYLNGATAVYDLQHWKLLVFSYAVNGVRLPITSARYRRYSPRKIHEQCAHTGAFVYKDAPDKLFTEPRGPN